MATLNKRKPAHDGRTHEGVRSMAEGPIPALQRMMNAHMLWEDTFYLDGKDAADQLKQAVVRAAKHDADATGEVIIAARKEMNIRHASLQAAVTFANTVGGAMGVKVLYLTISRADELTEALAMAGVVPGKSPKIANAVKRGVREAFDKFDEYQFGKYRGEGKAITLRDAVFITHPSPKTVPLVQKIVDGTLETPNTWETRLSGGEDKAAAFTDLLQNNKLGAMALLRNLRNMDQAGVNRGLIRDALEKATWSKVLPFRFMSAVQHAPSFAVELDEAFRKAVAFSVWLPGKTAVLVDTSGSMTNTLSERSTVQLASAGAVLGAAINGDHVDLYQWASMTKRVPNFRSLSTAMSIRTGEVGHGTHAVQAMEFAAKQNVYDRYILISDMQFSGGRGPYSRAELPELPENAVGYTINLAPYKDPGLMLGDWTHMSGFSANVLKYMASAEG